MTREMANTDTETVTYKPVSPEDFFGRPVAVVNIESPSTPKSRERKQREVELQRSAEEQKLFDFVRNGIDEVSEAMKRNTIGVTMAFSGASEFESDHDVAVNLGPVGNDDKNLENPDVSTDQGFAEGVELTIAKAKAVQELTQDPELRRDWGNLLKTLRKKLSILFSI